ncbi:hypothetical protein SAMN02745121_07304 [Nannocystis exedens]|uniref:Lipoprotein n=1 Tax=Nannocystis exedens TaxID=54 RepID=A0A1I2GJ78_9BACT|nr:hypothetical protein [Nannocystis exedens]PCC69921.1 hypothetical protein NAEX_02948 [Nannocystis exedens]SFF16681.1 hypothetical protein SAMN02745121_07304 [Nannocystis exedens]
MSTPRHLLRRSAVFALFVALASSPLACKKGADTAGPDAAGGSGDQAAGTELRYKAGPYKLRADVKFSFKATSPQGVNEAAGDLSGLLDVTDAGGKLKVGLSVTEVRDFVLGKDMLPPPKEGETPVDPKTAVQGFTGAFVADMRGELDEAGTKALPETAAAKEKKGVEAAVAGFATGVLGLPELPKVALVEGKTVETNERKDENLQGLVIPVDTASKFTLLKIDSSSGKRIAEIKYESESSGAVEQGKQMITLDVAAEGTVLFDLDDQLPVRRTSSSTTNISAGQMGFEIVNTIDTTFTRA